MREIDSTTPVLKTRQGEPPGFRVQSSGPCDWADPANGFANSSYG